MTTPTDLARARDELMSIANGTLLENPLVIDRLVALVRAIVSESSEGFSCNGSIPRTVTFVAPDPDPGSPTPDEVAALLELTEMDPAPPQAAWSPPDLRLALIDLYDLVVTNPDWIVPDSKYHIIANAASAMLAAPTRAPDLPTEKPWGWYRDGDEGYEVSRDPIDLDDSWSPLYRHPAPNAPPQAPGGDPSDIEYESRFGFCTTHDGSVTEPGSPTPGMASLYAEYSRSLAASSQAPGSPYRAAVASLNKATDREMATPPQAPGGEMEQAERLVESLQDDAWSGNDGHGYIDETKAVPKVVAALRAANQRAEEHRDNLRVALRDGDDLRRRAEAAERERDEARDDCNEATRIIDTLGSSMDRAREIIRIIVDGNELVAAETARRALAVLDALSGKGDVDVHTSEADNAT